MATLFGTDGIRGKANAYPLTAEMAVKVGRATALYFKKAYPDLTNAKIYIGKDTRISGDIFEHGLAAGIASMGIDVCLLGVIPTPGVAFITSNDNTAIAGIVVSASHNPFYDNGIKLFGPDGFKLSDDVETEIETKVLEKNQCKVCESIESTGVVSIDSEKIDTYHQFLYDIAKERIYNPSELNIVIDCSNGAVSSIAPKLFSQLSISVIPLFISPNGTNINLDCGSEHTDAMKQKVLEVGADMGLAFDGDGDRLIAVDHTGSEVSGDQIIAICSKYALEKSELTNKTVVTTVMSNLGLKTTLSDLKIQYHASSVGDRNVMMLMKEKGAVIGGEDSGHMIFLNHHSTGDGLLSAIKLLEAVSHSNKKINELADIMPVFPQVLVNVDVKEKPDIQTIPEIASVINECETKLQDKGRVLVRYSGTQPVCRVMVEGPTQDETALLCEKIADVIRKEIGS